MPLNTQIDGNVLDINYREPWYIQNPPTADSWLGALGGGAMSLLGKKKDPNKFSTDKDPNSKFMFEPPNDYSDGGEFKDLSSLSSSSFADTIGSFFG